jgi:hypothetical protein
MNRYGDFPSFGGSGPDPQQLNGPVAKEYLQVRKDKEKDWCCILFKKEDASSTIPRMLRPNSLIYPFLIMLNFFFTGTFPGHGLHHLLRR